MLALLLACAPARQDVEMEAGGVAPAELAGGLNVRVEGDVARLELYVTNVTDGPITLEFTTSQRYDFEVHDGTGALVWRWSDEMMFGQALGEEVLTAGETRSYTESWPVAGRQGEYVARAVLVSQNYAVDLRTPFRAGED